VALTYVVSVEQKPAYRATEICIYVYIYSYVYIFESGSSVSIVSSYGLDDWTIEVRTRAETKGFFL
jgi:hypothetical protein